jgi:hypothetical protein
MSCYELTTLKNKRKGIEHMLFYKNGFDSDFLGSWKEGEKMENKTLEKYARINEDTIKLNKYDRIQIIIE